VAYQAPLNGGRINATIGGNTAGVASLVSTGTMVLAGGNNITLSQNGGNAITINGAAGGGGAALSAAGGSVSNGTVVFSASNGVGFGMNGSTITASHNALTSQSNQALSGSNGSFTFQTASFGNLNGMSFYSSNGSLVGSHNGITSQTLQTANNIQALVGGTATSTASTGTVTFANSNGVSFGMSGNTMTASVAAGGGGGVAIAGNGTTYSSGTANLSAAGGALTIASATGAGGSQSFNFSVPQTSSIAGTGMVSISTNGSTINVGAPVMSLGVMGTDGGSTSGTSGTVSNGLYLYAGSNVVMSQSTGAAGASVTVDVAGGGGGATYSYYSPQDAYLQVPGQQGQGTLHLQPTPAPNVTFDRAVFPISFSGATNSTASITLSMYMGIYTRTGSTLSLSTSVSGSQAITHSGTANSSLNLGLRLFTMGASFSLSEAQYVVGIMSRSATGGANASLSQILASQANTNFSGLWGQASTVSTVQYTRGLGVYSASTSALPASVGFSQMHGTNSNVLRQPLFYLVNGTV
jgi:hypothetical protein